MYDIPTAEETREKLKKRLEENDALWAERVKKAIQVGIDNYSIQTCVDGRIPESLAKHLAELGYNVSYDRDNDGLEFTKISAQEDTVSQYM